MARNGIEQQQVFDAAHEITEAGNKPTVQAVRELLGTGSFTTITNHLAQWREQQAPAANQNTPPLPDAVQAAFARAWQLATKAARDEVEQQREAFESRTREMEAEQAEMKAEIQRLEQALEEQTQLGEQLRHEGETIKATSQEQAEQIVNLRIENTRLDEQKAAAVQRGDEFKAQLEALQAEVTAHIKPNDDA